MLFQPRRQVRHADIRLSLYLDNNGALVRAQFTTTARPILPGTGSIRPLLEPNSRGWRNFEGSSGCPGTAGFKNAARRSSPI
jgi:hypothetical protein